MKRKHRLGWQDEGLAQLVSCEGVKVPDDTVISTDSADLDKCPRCGDTLKLVWNVYVEEVPQARGREPTPRSDVTEAYCLAHHHATREEETICSLRFQLAERDREHQELIETAWWVIPLLRDATKPTNAEFLGRIWSEAACKRLASLESYFDRFPLPTPTPEVSR